PPARDVGRLVALAQQRGWEVCVICTPDGLKFVDVPGLAAQTGHPVRARYMNPRDPEVLPPPRAVIAAPATLNTVNKWAYGIADTLALGLLIEGPGLGIPIVAIPYTNSAMAAHPAFKANIARLRSWGITVLYGDNVIKLHPPGTGESRVDDFPWHLAIDALP